MAGQIGVPSLSVYNATKFAVVGMSEAMRGDLEPFGIGASVLCPGFVATDIYFSERNRPGELGGENASKFNLGQEAGAALDQLPGMMPAQVIGDMVLHAIQNDVFYIMSHSEMKDAVSQRGQMIGEAFDYWAGYRQEHKV
jgi:short-subunit dehydrogenase